MSETKELAALRAEVAEMKELLGRPTFQCSDCGSTGPFEDVVYPATPDCPEEYDMRCVECDSLHIDESPRCAFATMQNRLDTERAEAIVRAETAESRVAALEAALRPFALYAAKFDARPLRNADDVIHAIHAGEDGAEIRLSDCRRARALLAPATPCAKCGGDGWVSQHGADTRDCPRVDYIEGAPYCACDGVPCPKCRKEETR